MPLKLQPHNEGKLNSNSFNNKRDHRVPIDHYLSYF